MEEVTLTSHQIAPTPHSVQVNDDPTNRADTDTSPVLWRSCSGCLIDKRVLLFTAQAGISAVTAGFCMYQLTTQHGCESQGLYSGILSLILGTWLPQPQVASGK